MIYANTIKSTPDTIIMLYSGIYLRAKLISRVISPTSQQIVISNQQSVPSHGYTLQGINNPDADAVKILKEALPFVQSGKSLPLEVKKLKVRTPGNGTLRCLSLDISKKKITIEIVDDRSLFYAAQTLKQLVGYNEAGKRTLPLCTITDYPDVLHRGTVEGFYGTPWSHDDRISQLRFYGQFKMNTYIYGPKDDPFPQCQLA